MAEKDTGEPDEASLELPSLFGRKKKKGKRDAGAVTPPASEESQTSEASEAAQVSEAREAGTPGEDTAVIAPAQPTEQPTTAEPVATEQPVADEPTQQVAPQPQPQPEPVTPEPVTPEPVAPAPEVDAEPTPTPVGGRRIKRSRPARAEKAETTPKPPRPKRELPPVRASIAALIVGAVIGLLGVGLTFGALQTCELITGTDSCGGPGLLLVLLVVIVMVMTGTALLRVLGVGEPGGLSFLGVAIFVAICLVFLLEQLLEPWMVVVGPVLCALSYGTAHWVVNRFNTELLAEEGPEPHDVR